MNGRFFGTKLIGFIFVIMLMNCVDDVDLEPARCDPNPCNEPHKNVCSVNDEEQIVCSCNQDYIDNGEQCVQCTSGICCGPDGFFKGGQEKCDSWYIYRCSGSGCRGYKTQRKEVVRYCSTDAPDCTGATIEDEDWLDVSLCSGADEICQSDGVNPTQCMRCNHDCRNGQCCGENERCRYNKTCGRTARIEAYDAEIAQQFGLATALDGDYLVVGAPGAKNGTQDSMGAAYIFHRIGPNTWDQGFKVTAEADAEAFAQFGETVAIMVTTCSLERRRITSEGPPICFGVREKIPG